MPDDDELTFGDSEPEDSWHPDDPVPEQLENLRRRLVLLREKLDHLAEDRERLRLRDLEVDLAFIIARLKVR